MDEQFENDCVFGFVENPNNAPEQNVYCMHIQRLPVAALAQFHSDLHTKKLTLNMNSYERLEIF